MKKKRVLIVGLLFVSLFLLMTYFAAYQNKKALTAMAQLNAENIVVVVDAGHGGIDGGTSAADGTVEKNINLEIALKLNEMLELAGISTVMTREDDRSIHDETAKTIRQQKVSDIHNRLSLVESTDNSVLVSIHQNYYSQTKYKGSQVFYSKNNLSSRVLADSIQDSIKRLLQPDNNRGTKQSGTEIYLLYHAQKPAVLVECGFLSNADETQLLKQEDYQKQIAFAVMGGIFDFLNIPEEV